MTGVVVKSYRVVAPGGHVLSRVFNNKAIAEQFAERTRRYGYSAPSVEAVYAVEHPHGRDQYEFQF